MDKLFTVLNDFCYIIISCSSSTDIHSIRRNQILSHFYDADNVSIMLSSETLVNFILYFLTILLQKPVLHLSLEKLP